MSTPDGDKEYHVFLFEQVLLCCKDQGKKKRKNTKEEQLTYAIRGNILLTSIVETVNASKPAEQQFGIRIYWKDVADMESFSLKCRNEEQVILWKQRLELLIDEQRLRRRSAQSEDRNSHHIPAHVIGSNTMRFSSGDLESVRSWDDRDSRDARSSTHSTRSFALQSPDPNRILGSPRRSRGPSSSGQNTGDGGQRTASLQGGTRTYRSGTASSADYRYLSENSQSSPSDYDANDRWSFRSSNPGPPPPSALPATPLTSPVDSIGFPFSSNNRSSSDLRASSGLYRTSLKEEQFAEDLRKLNVNAEGEGATLYKSDPQLKSSQSATSLAQSNSSIGPSISSGFIKVKLFYANDIFVIALPSTSCTLSELTSKIERKLRLCGMALPEGKTLKLKYKDEDNDLIQIYGDDDIIMALDTSRMDRGPEGDRGIVHIYVE